MLWPIERDRRHPLVHRIPHDFVHGSLLRDDSLAQDGAKRQEDFEMGMRGGRGFEVKRHAPGIALVTFNQPDRLNGMTQPLKRDLDETVRVVVFMGSGRAFSAGDDLAGDYQAHGKPAQVPALPGGHRTPIGTYDALRVISQSVNLAVRGLDKLTVAAINGYAIQSGLSLALACDFR